MWAKLDDSLFDHAKISEAGRLIDKRVGRAIALGFYTASILWASKHLTNGYLSEAVLEGFPHVDEPLAIADAFTQVGLFERENGGFRIHDYTDWNPSAQAMKRKLRADRDRKRRKKEH
jgi:hypothetical protein